MFFWDEIISAHTCMRTLLGPPCPALPPPRDPGRSMFFRGHPPSSRTQHLPFLASALGSKYRRPWRDDGSNCRKACASLIHSGACAASVPTHFLMKASHCSSRLGADTAFRFGRALAVVDIALAFGCGATTDDKSNWSQPKSASQYLASFFMTRPCNE